MLRQVRPLVGVGLGTIGTDGEGLPAAAMRALEAALRQACPPPVTEEAPPAGKDAKAAKAAPPPKGGAKGAPGADSVEAEAKAERISKARAAAQCRVVGFPILSWKCERSTRLATVPCVRWTKPKIMTAAEMAATEAEAAGGGGAAAAKGGKSAPAKGAAPVSSGPELVADAPPAPAPRCGHSMNRVVSGFVLFGGSGARGLLSDAWLLKIGAAGPGADASAPLPLGWLLPVVTGAPPPARAFHTAAVRAGTEASGGLEQLLVCGGTDGRRSVGTPNCLPDCRPIASLIASLIA